MIHHKHLFTALILFITSCVYGQQNSTNQIDSIKSVIQNTDNDTVVVHNLRLWYEMIFPTDLETCDSIVSQILKVSKENLKKNLSKAETKFFKTAQAKAHFETAYIYYYQYDYTGAVDQFNMSLALGEELNNHDIVMNSLCNAGAILGSSGKYIESIEYLTRALKMSEEIGDTLGSTNMLNNIGSNHNDLKNYDKAKEYYRKAIDISVRYRDTSMMGASFNNIGITYFLEKNYDRAKHFFSKALECKLITAREVEIASAYQNLGNAHYELGELADAEKFYEKAMIIYEKQASPEGIAMMSINYGKSKLDRGMYSVALEYGLRAYKLSVDLNLVDLIKESSALLYDIYKVLGRHKEALEMYEISISTRDSIESEANQKAVIRQEYKYEYEKQAAADSIKALEEAKVKDAQLLAEQAQNKQHKLEAKQQEQQKYFLFGGLALALLFGGFIFNRFRVTAKQKTIIETQKQKVDQAYDELEEKNTEILDSINYAKRIQSAILPPNKLVKEYLQESFILYKPKDIVAGDFYWLEPTTDGVMFATADCTGHGVPGAMVSVVCNNGLNRAVREYGLKDPGQILDKTKEIVISEFEKSEEDVKDGMDIALCYLVGNTLKYAGAHNPLWIVRSGADEIEEIKALNQPIGKYAEATNYPTHTIVFNEGDTFYTFTDGYADQFGGDKGKKLKAKNFKNLLLSIQNESMEKQKELIDQAFENWRGSYEQLDDVCVIGVRV